MWICYWERQERVIMDGCTNRCGLVHVRINDSNDAEAEDEDDAT